MPCKTTASVLLMAMLLGGCKQPYYVTECDLSHYQQLGLPPGLACDPAASVRPSASNEPPPPTPDSPERPIRFITLTEAIAIALEQGTPGSPALDGTTGDSLVVFAGTGVAAGETPIRVLSLDPAIIQTNIESSLSKFDARWVSGMTWQTTDQPNTNTFLGTTTGTGTGIGGTGTGVFGSGSLATDVQAATLSSSLIKPLPTGGTAGITFRTDYSYESNLTGGAGVVNPAYRPSLQFAFEQPLLQGFGVEINQLRPSHPGSSILPVGVSSRTEGILITRIRFDQERTEFERQLHVLLTNVEVAYWNLYGSYGVFYATEQGMRQAYEAWRINVQRYNIGRVDVVPLAQSRGQYELFRSQRLTALNEVLEAEHQLRGLLRLPMSDGTRLVPADAPTLAPYQPDWSTSVNQALALRPELILARDDLKARQLDLILQRNSLLPDLRLTSTYGITGLGTHLDGGAGDPNNALHSLASDQFTNWSVGLNLNVPIGFRDAHSAVRSSRLALARSFGVLRDQEIKAQRFVGQRFRLLDTDYRQIEALRSQREAEGVQVDARFREYIVGRGTLDFLLQAQRDWSAALIQEYQSIAAYNAELARFSFATGTIMDRDNITIGEGPLPGCAQVRAVEHERERAKALILRERANPVTLPVRSWDGNTVLGLPAMSPCAAPSVPAMLEGQAGLPPLPTNLSSTVPVAAAISEPEALPGGAELRVIPAPINSASANR